jgi:ribose transport system substrate-binding protein
VSLTRPKKLAKVGVAALAAALAMSACGSDDEVASPAGEASSGGNAAAVPAGVMSMDELYAGTYSDPPSESPSGAEGKSVWWISASQGDPAAAAPALAAQEAAEALGIDFNIADGKFNQGGAFSTAVQTAVAAQPDAILLFGVPCELVLGPLQDAKAQGIKLMGVETPDCSDSGGPQMFDVVEQYSEEYQSTPDLWRGFGAINASYIINRSGGDAKVIVNAGTEPLQEFVTEGFRAELEKCSGCSIVAEVPYDSAALTPNGPWIQAFRSALVKHPDATAAYFPFDFMATALGGAQAVKESGLELVTFGGQATGDGLDAVRSGALTAIPSARSPEWSGYAAMDTINRALQGQPAVPQGIGFQTVDDGHNLSEAGAYEPPIDFKAAYLKAWGASS